MALTVGTDTYVSLADANAYFAGRPHATAWQDPKYDDAAKEAALIFACMHLDGAYEFVGRPATPGQPLKWPRCQARWTTGGSIPEDEIPSFVKKSQCELASQWLVCDQLMPMAEHMTSSDAAALKGGIKREKLGPMEREYFGASNLFSTAGTPATKLYPLVDLILGPYKTQGPNSLTGRLVV